VPGSPRRTPRAGAADAAVEVEEETDLVRINDEPMFGFFDHSVGVSTVATVASRLKALATWITKGAGGDGFVEVADLCQFRLHAQQGPHSLRAPFMTRVAGRSSAFSSMVCSVLTSARSWSGFVGFVR